MDYFSSLPNEILVEVFEYCKLLPLSLVCRKFNEVISCSPTLMRKISLVISEKTPALKPAQSERSHRAIYFKFNYKINESCLEILTTFSEIKSLELMRCIVKADLFLQMLKLLPNLEMLSIYTTYLRNAEEIKDFEPPELKKLKRLNFRTSDEKFLKCLHKSSLESLYIGYPAQYSMKTLLDFLQTQSNIKAIEYLNVACVDASLMTLITQDLPRLENLHLESDKLDMNLIGSLELFNTSVKFLNLYGNFSHAADSNVVLSFFKSLEVLEIEMNNMLEPAIVQQFSPKLQSLSIILCSGDFFNAIQLNSLKRLKLSDGSFTADEWSRFAVRNPSVESIVIKDESITNEIFRHICLEFRNLKHLELFYDPQRLTQQIIDFICAESFPRNIQSIRISQRNSSAGSFFTLSDEHKKEIDTNLGFRAIFN